MFLTRVDMESLNFIDHILGLILNNVPRLLGLSILLEMLICLRVHNVGQQD